MLSDRPSRNRDIGTERDQNKFTYNPVTSVLVVVIISEPEGRHDSLAIVFSFFRLDCIDPQVPFGLILGTLKVHGCRDWGCGHNAMQCVSRTVAEEAVLPVFISRLV
jgi:hypothetical protein